MTKQEMEAIWRERGVQQISNYCLWDETGRSASGAKANIELSAAARAFRWKVLSGHDFPPWPKTQPRDTMPSAETRTRYKELFPRNYKALLEAYGKTRTRYDDPRQFDMSMFK